MTFKHAFLQVLVLVGCSSSTLAHLNHRRTDGVAWSNCTEPTLVGLQCANFTVPLDYSDPNSQATLDLQLTRSPALLTPNKGTIFWNFGGPGNTARASLAESQSLTGGEYDLVAFDPRGTGNTITASCFNTTVERQLVVGEPNSVSPGIEDELAVGRQWGQTQVVANTCSNYPGFQQRGSLLGTSFVARDIMQMVDAFEEDGLLRYYGFSYGTVLGATVAAMFPDRIDRMVLDGVLNPHEYWNDYDIEAWADSDKTLHGVMEECVKAGADACALAARSSNASGLTKDIYNLLEDLRIEPLVAGTLLIDSSLVESYIRFSLYAPPFGSFTRGLDALLSGNTTAFAVEYAGFIARGNDLSTLPDESPFAILCGDKQLPEQTFTEMVPVLEAFEQESRFVGTSGIVQAMICQNWNIGAKERYEGDFDIATKHPVLVIGNTYDVATPLRSAQNISSSFQNAVVLENNGFGHTSIAHGSTCTVNAVRAYFQDGTLPEDGTFCEVDYAPFDPVGIVDFLQAIGYAPSQ
ncbi:hypothetical protein BDV06DRAFT_232195 [Aspergillus oleicola]